MLHLSLSFMELKLEHFTIRSEILWEFWNVVSKEVGVQLDRSYEESSFKLSQGKKGYPTYNKIEVGSLDWSRLA
jgi:hypothetical protein